MADALSRGRARRFWQRRPPEMTPQDAAEEAMRKGLVDVVAALLGEPPTHMYDYGMQPAWKLRARQWVADQRRPTAIYPIHCWSAGYGGPQTPLTWFECSTCGNRTLGSPDALPEHHCMLCLFDERVGGWVVADSAAASTETMQATEGMPENARAKVRGTP